jgi:murein L,D-transpeptidase YcbB/YkuD
MSLIDVYQLAPTEADDSSDSVIYWPTWPAADALLKAPARPVLRKQAMRIGHPVALGLIIATSLGLPAFAAEPDGTPTLIARTEAVRITIQDRLLAKPSAASVRKAEQDALMKYYAPPDQNLLWINENGLTERGKAIIAEIKKADDYGLRASDYALPNPDGFKPNDAKATDWLADAEIKVSYAVLDYARDARGGRIDPQRLSENLDPTLALPDPSEVIASIAVRSDPVPYLRSFQPDQPQFEALRRKLVELRHNGSKETGANNGKIRTILVNMERWRWLPHDLGSYYVNVNVPEFMLRVVEKGKVIHTARVVVGKPNKQTPIFSQDMQEVVFNPVWNVPNSIKTEEILPFLTSAGGWFGGGSNTAIFEQHNLRVKYGGREVDPRAIDWGRVDIRNFEIYQPPGPDNVLGHVKFGFPNKHDVYMHDTTMRDYYGQSMRAESHGCMRVQYPDQLAFVLLKHDQDWTQARVASAIRNSSDNHVALHQKIPVYISYFTLRVNDDGSISTFGDIYGHDARMAAALSGRSVAFDALTKSKGAVASQGKPPGRQIRQRNTLTNNLVQAHFGF